MLKKFTLKNYKNFKDKITIDFENIAGYQFNTDCLSDGIIGKMLIYGRNATGKTNFGRALLDIGLTIFGGTRYASNGILLNADSKEETAVFRYEFKFEDAELDYKYSRFSNQELCDEELSINGKNIFKCNFSLKEYDFDNLDYIHAETANIDRYLQSLESEDEVEISEPKLPFLRWLISNVAFKNDSPLIRLANYVRRMMMITVGNGMQYRGGRFNQNFYESLENPERLKDFEDFLNAMGIECKLVLKKLPDGQRELYFSHEKLVPFYENASRKVSVIEDNVGNKIVFIHDIVFKGKRSVAWSEVETYLKQFVGEVYTIEKTEDLIYIGADLPDEYAHSNYRMILKGANAKAKANAAQGLPEIIEIATKRAHKDNYKEKHGKDAKYGWYGYESRFALPILNSDGEIERYNVFKVLMIVRHAENGKMYLYDIVNIKKETSNLFQS